MKIDKFWVVRNPAHSSSVKRDILMEFTLAEYTKYALGSVNLVGSLSAFNDENHTLHTSEMSASADADLRLQIRDDYYRASLHLPTKTQ